MKKKQKYEQPRTQVVELRVTNQLLAGSNGLNSLDPFSSGGDPLTLSTSRMDDIV